MNKVYNVNYLNVLNVFIFSPNNLYTVHFEFHWNNNLHFKLSRPMSFKVFNTSFFIFSN